MVLAEFKSSITREAGFSLIETMVATMLLAIALVATAQLMVTCDHREPKCAARDIYRRRSRRKRWSSCAA